MLQATTSRKKARSRKTTLCKRKCYKFIIVISPCLSPKTRKIVKTLRAFSRREQRENQGCVGKRNVSQLNEHNGMGRKYTEAAAAAAENIQRI